MRGHAALLLLTAGLGLALPATAQDKSAIETERPWARASIGTARPAAAYGTLVNTGSEAMRLVAVETPVAGRAEAHRTVRDGDVMRMEPAEIVEVPAGAQVEFAPGGLHIMLMDLKQPLNKGDSFPMTLRFDSGEAIELTVPVLGPGSRGPTE